MKDEDREYLLVHFEMTAQMLAEQVRGLSQAQLEYRASPDRWAIRECVSHLAVADPDYWRDLMKSVKAPPDMKGKKSANTDADILWYGTASIGWWIRKRPAAMRKSILTKSWSKPWQSSRRCESP
jgi:hypothetical protein